jgi:hypothetical protein
MLTIDTVSPDYSDLTRSLGIEPFKASNNADIVCAYNGQCFTSEADAVMMACLDVARRIAYERSNDASFSSTTLQEWVRSVKGRYK